MNALSLHPTDLTTYNGEPRIKDLRLAEVLDFAEKRAIRKLIKRNEPELRQHGEVCGAVQQTPLEERDTVSRPGMEYLLNEAQALVISMLARTPKAPEVRKMVIDVFMEWRRGQLAPARTSTPEPITGEAVPVLTAKLALVREARHLFGHDRAKSLWQEVGLPVPEYAPDGGQEEARRCLEQILGYMPDASGPMANTSVREMIELAMDDNEAAERSCATLGIRMATPDQDGFLISNRHPLIVARFRGTDWDYGRHVRVLRRLTGACPAPKARYGTFEARGTFIPARYLEEMPLI